MPKENAEIASNILTQTLQANIREFTLLCKLIDHEPSIKPRYYQLRAELTHILGHTHPLIKDARTEDDARTIQKSIDEADDVQHKCNELSDEIAKGLARLDRDDALIVLTNALIKTIYDRYGDEKGLSFGTVVTGLANNLQGVV